MARPFLRDPYQVLFINTGERRGEAWPRKNAENKEGREEFGSLRSLRFIAAARLLTDTASVTVWLRLSALIFPTWFTA